MAKDSEKPVVFSHLFQQLYDRKTGSLHSSTVTQQDIQDAILVLQQEEGISLKTSNPPNFLKDFLRSHSRNTLWPEEIAEARYTARQQYGDGKVFDFVPYADEQSVPFPDDFILPKTAAIHTIEAISLPSAARALGRRGEAWLIQVCVNQRILQTHFALFSDLEIIDLYHLQNSLKGAPEIDAVFLVTLNVENTQRTALITLEAKLGDPILPDQIKGQVARMAKQTKRNKGLRNVDLIIPVAATTKRHNGSTVISLFEMEPISVADGILASDTKEAHQLPLVIAKSVGYRLEPSVSGI